MNQKLIGVMQNKNISHYVVIYSANNDSLKMLDLSWNHLRGHGASAVGYSLTVKFLN